MTWNTGTILGAVYDAIENDYALTVPSINTDTRDLANAKNVYVLVTTFMYNSFNCDEDIRYEPQCFRNDVYRCSNLNYASWYIH